MNSSLTGKRKKTLVLGWPDDRGLIVVYPSMKAYP